MTIEERFKRLETTIVVNTKFLIGYGPAWSHSGDIGFGDKRSSKVANNFLLKGTRSINAGLFSTWPLLKFFIGHASSGISSQISGRSKPTLANNSFGYGQLLGAELPKMRLVLIG